LQETVDTSSYCSHDCLLGLSQSGCSHIGTWPKTAAHNGHTLVPDSMANLLEDQLRSSGPNDTQHHLENLANLVSCAGSIFVVPVIVLWLRLILLDLSTDIRRIGICLWIGFPPNIELDCAREQEFGPSRIPNVLRTFDQGNCKSETRRKGLLYLSSWLLSICSRGHSR